MKKSTLGLGALAIVLGVVAVSTNTALAYRGDPAVQGPNYTAERHEAMTKAFAENNYEAWKELMQGRGRVSQLINKDNFSKFVEAHNLALQGKIEEAQKIREELGLGLKDGSGKSFGKGFGGMGRGMNR